MAVDLTASIMCLENKMPMLVFGLNEENSIVETMTGTFTGTVKFEDQNGKGVTSTFMP